jgi:hypothetical protein
MKETINNMTFVPAAYPMYLVIDTDPHPWDGG